MHSGIRRLSDYKITNRKFGCDLVKEYVDAFRAEGLKVGLYFSLLDWYHPDFLVDGYHPERNNEKRISRVTLERYGVLIGNSCTDK